MDDGLPSAEVVDLAQDASGRLWVLTAGGLTLYDGQTWTAPPRAG
jgi:ligand-binding sensor domain-containing protein